MTHEPSPGVAITRAYGAGWEEAVGHILADARRVLVLGPVDAGKSTFCRALLGVAAKQGQAATLLDGDVGQKMVGPPAAVTRADAAALGKLTRLAFVGTTDPVQGFARLVSGLGQLGRAARSGLLVVNTGGLLAGAGRKLKAAKIRAVRPDLLVTIGNDPALEAILSEHSNLPSLRLATPPDARRKGPGQRREARREAFRHHLAPGQSHDVAVPAGELARLSVRQLVGLVDAAGRDLALGIVEAIDPASGLARVLSPAPPGAIRRLVAGRIRLDANYDLLPP